MTRKKDDHLPYFCWDCVRAHKHSDGLVFCSPRAARLKEEDRPPEGCLYGKQRKGPITRSAVTQEQSNKYSAMLNGGKT